MRRFFEPAAGGARDIAFVAALYFIGVVGWAYVMGWGLVPLDFHDWTGINLPRLIFLQNALREGIWPLHMEGGAALHGVTDRFLTLPDVITSPQSLLLLFMPVSTFVVVDVLIQYSVGFWGILLLRRYLQWSPYAFTVVYLLFLFNGHILAHYSVGHFTWGAYFVFPIVVLFVLRFLDGDDSWRSIGWFAAAMFYMVLIGGQHHMTWVLLLLGLMVPFCWRRAWWLVTAGAAAGLLSAVRLLPPVLELASFRKAGLVSDVLGFPSVAHLVIALTMLRRQSSSFNANLPGNIWFFDNAYFEYGAFVGVVGLALIVLGAYRWLRENPPRYPELIVPTIALIALSLGSTYRIVRLLSIPLLESERYTARLFSLPLFIVIVLAATSLDRAFRQWSMTSWHRVVALAALGYVALDIAANVRLWRVAVSAGLFGAAPFAPGLGAIIQRPDPLYVQVVVSGLVITATTAVALIVLARRRPKTI